MSQLLNRLLDVLISLASAWFGYKKGLDEATKAANATELEVLNNIVDAGISVDYLSDDAVFDELRQSSTGKSKGSRETKPRTHHSTRVLGKQ